MIFCSPCININSLCCSTRRQRLTKTMLRQMDNPTATRKRRRSCKFTSRVIFTGIFTPWNRAALSGGIVDRIVETKGVSVLLLFVCSCELNFVFTA